MNSVLRKKVVVQTGGHIEIDSPKLLVGSCAEVIVLLEPAPTAKSPLEDLIGAAPGCYGSQPEADLYLNQLRDQWES